MISNTRSYLNSSPAYLEVDPFKSGKKGRIFSASIMQASKWIHWAGKRSNSDPHSLRIVLLSERQQLNSDLQAAGLLRHWVGYDRMGLALYFPKLTSAHRDALKITGIAVASIGNGIKCIRLANSEIGFRVWV